MEVCFFAKEIIDTSILFGEYVTFGIYGLTVDESAPNYNGNKKCTIGIYMSF
jgi:hypothetical protein